MRCAAQSDASSNSAGIASFVACALPSVRSLVLSQPRAAHLKLFCASFAPQNSPFTHAFLGAVELRDKGSGITLSDARLPPSCGDGGCG